MLSGRDFNMNGGPYIYLCPSKDLYSGVEWGSGSDLTQQIDKIVQGGP